MAQKRLYLSKRDKKVFGVCGGMAEYLDADPTVVRLLWAVATLLTGVVPGVLAYVLAWMIIPQKK